LIYAPTFLPAYMQMITGSSALVGLGQALLQFGATLSPVIGASRIEHRQRLLPYAVRTGSMMRLQILALAIAGWLLGGTLLVGITLLLLFLLGFFTGSQRIAFQMLMAKVIPLRRRGRLQAWRNFAGGGVAAIVSLVAGLYLIGPNVFGNGYATTFFVAFLLTSVGLFFLQWLMREPDAVGAPLRTLRERVRTFPVLLSDRGYRAFLTTQALVAAARMSGPFYILYAGERLGLDGQLVGMMSFAFLASDTASNLLWGYLGDHRGFRLPLFASILISACSIAVLIFAPAALIVLAFCGFGAAAAGYLMSASTLVLEIGALEDVPMRMALSTTVEGALAALGPIAGGLIVWAVGFQALFGLSIALFTIAAISVWRIPKRGSAVLPI
jgi:MFS family permease